MSDAATASARPWDEIRTALGQLVLSASQMEDEVRLAVLNMLPGQDWRRTQLLVDGFSAGQMRENCARLVYEVTAGSLRDDALEWLKEVEAAQTSRNNIIHSTWADRVHRSTGPPTKGPTSTTRSARKPSKGLQVHDDDDHPASILRAAEQCGRARMTGLDIVQELQGFSLVEARDGVDLSPWTRSGSPTG